MHPLEHVLYFSAPALLWVVPSHPVVVLMLLMYSGLTPLDALFGTYHDGTPEAHEAMKDRRRNRV